MLFPWLKAKLPSSNVGSAAREHAALALHRDPKLNSPRRAAFRRSLYLFAPRRGDQASWRRLIGRWAM
jgi:hypothetical protein